MSCASLGACSATLLRQGSGFMALPITEYSLQPSPARKNTQSTWELHSPSYIPAYNGTRSEREPSLWLCPSAEPSQWPRLAREFDGQFYLNWVPLHWTLMTIDTILWSYLGRAENLQSHPTAKHSIQSHLTRKLDQRIWATYSCTWVGNQASSTIQLLPARSTAMPRV